MLAEEWLSTYEGIDKGPLDRQPRAVWLRCFGQTGYWEAEQMIRELSLGVFEETLTVHTDRTAPPAPDLWRISTRANRRRWSWVDDLLARAGQGAHVYRCREPRLVLARIMHRYELHPDTQFWKDNPTLDPRPWSKHKAWCEWIVIPGEDVRQMVEVDPGQHSDHVVYCEGSPG